MPINSVSSAPHTTHHDFSDLISLLFSLLSSSLHSITSHLFIVPQTSKSAPALVPPNLPFLYVDALPPVPSYSFTFSTTPSLTIPFVAHITIKHVILLTYLFHYLSPHTKIKTPWQKEFVSYLQSLEQCPAYGYVLSKYLLMNEWMRRWLGRQIPVAVLILMNKLVLLLIVSFEFGEY